MLEEVKVRKRDVVVTEDDGDGGWGWRDISDGVNCPWQYELTLGLVSEELEKRCLHARLTRAGLVGVAVCLTCLYL